MSAADGTARATPFFCPFCGEQDIRPSAQERTYHCRTCDRLWELRYLKLGNPEEEEG